MISDCKRRGAVLGSAAGGALGIDVESDDLPATGASVGSRSRGDRSHHKAGGQTPGAPPTFSGGSA
jgi:hypothetical protein